MDDEEQPRGLRQSPERHFPHERRRAVETQQLDRIRHALFAAQKVAQLEVAAGPLQARRVPPRREVLLERRSGPRK